MEFVATTNELFFGGKFVNGFAVGALASVTISYIGEVSLLALNVKLATILMPNRLPLSLCEDY